MTKNITANIYIYYKKLFTVLNNDYKQLFVFTRANKD